MADTYTTSNRFEKMEPGQYLDTWGTRWNAQGGSDLIDAAMDGVESFALSGSTTLTNNNGAADQARKRVLNVTGGTGGTITIPNVMKVYLVRNNSSSNVTITTGSGTTATVKSGAIALVFCDGANAVYQAIRPDFGTATVTAAGLLANGPTTGVGYATGAGASVTQITSKSTTVTSNTMTGKITMHNASLAANTTVWFGLFNSNIVQGDGLIVHVSSGEATPGSYQVWPTNVQAGSCQISVRNITAGALAETLVLSFNLIKGATS